MMTMGKRNFIGRIRGGRERRAAKCMQSGGRLGDRPQCRAKHEEVRMADSSLWWLLAGAAVAVELVTGTFYLLMLAIGLAAAALAAHSGAGLTTQLVAAAAI